MNPQQNSPQVKDEASKEFQSWFGGLLWADPYPDYQTIAREAWMAARDFYLSQQTNNQNNKEAK